MLPKNKPFRWTEKQKHSQEKYAVDLLPICQAMKHPHSKPCVQKFSAKKLYKEEIMHVGAVQNKESNKEFVVDNPMQNLWAKYFNLNFDPPIIKIASLNVEQLCTL